MKDKILTLIIGILIGAILATAGFYVYTKTKSNSTPQGIPTENFREMKGERRMQEENLPDENIQNSEAKGGNKQRRNKQSEDFTEEEPPEKPLEDSSRSTNSNNNTESNS